MSTTPTINEIMQRIKSLRQFTVSRELSEGHQFNGQIPFDITVKGSTARFKVYAVDLSEAETKVDEFLNN